MTTTRDFDYSRLESGGLARTDAGTERAWGWMPAFLPETGLGRLSIELTPEKGKRETTHYIVTEAGSLPGLIGRRFHLLPDHAEGETYEVVTGANPSCTCPAGNMRKKERVICDKCGGGGGGVDPGTVCGECGGDGMVGSVCKHQDAMKALLQEGIIE